VKENLFESRAFLLAVTLILFATPLAVLQAITVHGILLSGQIIKMVVAALFLILIFAHLLNRFSTWGILVVQLSLVFFTYNFFVIFALSSDSVGASNAIGAFLYNYSLLLFVLPYYWLSKPASLRAQSITKNWYGILAVLFLFADIYGLIEFQLNDYLLSGGAQELLQSGDYVKFDHIEGFIRVSSFFKSPLEFGFLNVFISGVVLSALLSKHRGLFIWSLFLVSSAGVFVTLSRTAILMYFVNVLLIFAFYVLMGRGGLFLSKRALGIWLLLLVITGIGISAIDLSQYFETSTNPTNLLIRLENWGELVNRLSDDPLAIWFGLGIVQNGSYGEYHEVIIDNLYLGAVMTGGICGLFLFISLCGLTIIDAWRTIMKLSNATKFMGFSLLSFFLAFAVGGFTENLMHIMFYPFVALLFLRWMPQYSEGNDASKLPLVGTRWQL